MTTRADLRDAVRQRLADAPGGPLWDDAALNDFLAEAMREYGIRFPREQAITFSVPAGATSVTISPRIEGHQVVRVADPAGQPIPRYQDIRDTSWEAAQAWSWWDSTLRLAVPAAGGSWRIDYLAIRELPSDDLTAVDIQAGDEALIVTLAAAIAMRQRAASDAKRGLGGEREAAATLADRLQRDAERLIAARRRRARGGWIAQ